jgi:cobalt-zinc-cadmium efflux system outer membrane protein
MALGWVVGIAVTPPLPAQEATVAQTSAEPMVESPSDAAKAASGWTLPSLIEQAMQRHPALMQQQATLQALSGRYWHVGIQPNPVVGYEGQQLGSRGLAEQDGVAVGQEVVRPIKLRSQREVVAAEMTKARQQLSAIGQRVATDVRIAYYDLLVARRREQVAADLVRISQQGETAARQLVEAKEVGKADLLQASIEAQQALIARETATNRAQAAWQVLATLTGLDPQFPEAVDGTLEAAPQEFVFESLLAQLRTASPEVAVAVAEIERAQRTLAREQVVPRPNVTVNGLVNYRDNGIGGRSDGGVAVSVPLPVWNRNQGGIREAYHQLQAAQHALARLEQQLTVRLAPVMERYRNSLVQYQRYQEQILPAASEALELSRRAYAAGEQGYVNYLTAQRTYVQTNLNFLDTLRDLRQSEALLEGMLLEGSFSELPGP